MLAVLVGASSTIGGAQADPIVVGAKPVLLNPFNPSLTRVGRFEYRGGLQLSSPDQRFGGLSGLLVSADGRRLTAVSDRGYWFEAGLVYDTSGALIGIDQAAVEQLRTWTDLSRNRGIAMPRASCLELPVKASSSPSKPGQDYGRILRSAACPYG